MADAGVRGFGYVTSRWGEPTQTFVRREASAIAAAGPRVAAWSLKAPVPASGSVIATHLGVGRVATGVARSILTRPRDTLRVLSSVVRHSAPRNLGAQLAAALIGIAWAGHRMHVDHLHCHFGWVAVTSTWAACSLTGTPYSVTLHAFDIHTERLQDRFTPVPLRAAKKVFCISELDAELVATRWGIPTGVSRMGVPRSWVQTPRVGADVAPRSSDLIVAVGSLSTKKGHDDLIRAVAAAPGWRLDVFGAGPEHEPLQALVTELGLVGRVRLLGSAPEPDVRRSLELAAVSALACRETRGGDRDGIPVALIEAMACGAPVVTTRLGGIPELVGDAGMLVDADDVPALTVALTRMQDPAERDRLAAAAQDVVLLGWTVEANAAALLQSIGWPP